MDKTASQTLKSWFDSLSPTEKREVLRFVYGDLYVERPLLEGVYCGPAPEMIKKGGLYAGPAPSSLQAVPNRCPTCQRPY